MLSLLLLEAITRDAMMLESKDDCDGDDGNRILVICWSYVLLTCQGLEEISAVVVHDG